MTKPFSNVLVASPSPVVRQRVLDQLCSAARRFGQVSGGAEALDHLEREPWNVLYLDQCLPDLDVEELRHTVRRRFPEIEVVLLNPTDENGLPPSEPEATQAAPQWSCFPNSVPDMESNTTESTTDAPLPGMVGTSAAMRRLYRMARLAAPRTTTILISGPSGSGKELVARAIHTLSPRAARPFVVVNCAAIPETLLESELFGYNRGAFTGALQSYGGRIHAAQGGTLFLDEIGEMPLNLQPKLLRFLEQKELQRLGSPEIVKVDVRVLAATNAALPALVRERRFRSDLYYRLSAFPLEIPALRERGDDIAALARHLLEKLAMRDPSPVLSPHAMQMLLSQPWPGNVRELQNVMERALILAGEGQVIGPEPLMLSPDLPAR